MLARRFLGCVVILVLLAVAGAFLLFEYGNSILLRSATPKGHFEAPAAASSPDYSKPDNWAARPGMMDDPSLYVPTGAISRSAGSEGAATFFVHPTTYLLADRWNAPLRPGGQAETNIGLFLQSQASAFNAMSEIWAPRYRQAAYGAFLLTNRDATQALDLAYGDVRAAFDEFLRSVPADRPIVLAGHSQGAMHVLRLLRDRRDVLRGRLVAAYIGGWPVGRQSDLSATGVSACDSASTAGCVIAWQSFGEPANTKPILDAWVGTTGLSGRKRSADDIVCVNPLTGTEGSEAPPAANFGTLVPDATLGNASIVVQRVGARCRDGFLLLTGEVPEMGPFVLPGNNYHVYDYALFWANLRADAERRLAAWRAR